MSKISAKIIADSIDTRGNRLISYVLTYPRFIHSELMTHRMFSRNSASSRAIPFKKMIEKAKDDPFIPIAWQKDHKGMQGDKYITDSIEINNCKMLWQTAIDHAIEDASRLNSVSNITKQLCNRLLEPFMWHTVLVTATEYDNFFELRCPRYINEHEAGEDVSYSRKDFIIKLKKRYPTNWESDLKNFHGIENNEDWEWARLSKSGAEIHIQILAEAMWDARNESTPNPLKAGEWHIPFGDKINAENFVNANAHTLYNNGKGIKANAEELRIQVAIARCARLSYMTHDNKIDYEKDIELYNRLLSAHHMSPFEHCAKMMTDKEYNAFVKGYREEDKGFDWLKQSALGWCLNFRGFMPYRYFIEDGTI